MPLANVELGKVIFFKPSADQSAVAKKRGERAGVEVTDANSATEIVSTLSGSGRGVLVLCTYSNDTRAVAKAIREQKGLKQLPVFAIIPDEVIDTKILKQANDQKIELIPTSLPEARRWEKFREAAQLARSGGRWRVCNRRAHFRLPLKVKATLMCDAETIDLSLGGIGFSTNQVFHIGDRAKVDIRSLLGDMEESERGFEFEVVSVKPQKGELRYLVGGRFVDLSETAVARLREALELIEPTSGDE